MHMTLGKWKLATFVAGVTNCFFISIAWSQVEDARFEGLIEGQRFQYLQFFGLGAGMSTVVQPDVFKEIDVEAFSRITETQLNENVAEHQLLDLHGQKKFVNNMQPMHPIRRSAIAWWQQNNDIKLPQAFFSSLSDSDYLIERLHKYRDSLKNGANVGLPRAALNGRDKMEVETGEAAIAILTKLSVELHDKNDAVWDDIQEDEERIRSCNAAVNTLRAPFEQTGGNVLDQFDQICLFGNDPRVLTDVQRVQAIQCLNLYATYDAACFYERFHNAKTALAPLGVLFKAGGQFAATIHCMAYRISRDIVLTARHCLDGEIMQDSYRMHENIFYFQPFQHQINRNEMISLAQSLGRPAACSIVRIIDPANFDLRVEVPPIDKIKPEDDMVLLQTMLCPKQMLNEGKTARQLKLRVGAAPMELEPLILTGFNDMAFRIALLRARLEDRDLPGDFELLVDGSWRRFVRQDESAVCRIGTVDSPLRQQDLSLRQLGHYCQTQPGMSGAPLIAMRNVARGQGTHLNDGEVARLVAEPVLVGIHRRAPGMVARIEGDIPERNGPPNAGISLGNQVSTNLTKLIQAPSDIMRTKQLWEP